MQTSFCHQAHKQFMASSAYSIKSKFFSETEGTPHNLAFAYPLYLLQLFAFCQLLHFLADITLCLLCLCSYHILGLECLLISIPQFVWLPTSLLRLIGYTFISEREKSNPRLLSPELGSFYQLGQGVWPLSQTANMMGWDKNKITV